ncbi:hypothetical protein VMCG_04210 [Cytospora schulzeri]|uniref:Ecp2 effector protein domain-containing protein n=1 Tax=Cytospora schulzeri TaxID=448051 RepID=A0A423WU07_9PEZI|nr:hypothetical protein VMCG_04210 [Valsa malicola]
MLTLTFISLAIALIGGAQATTSPNIMCQIPGYSQGIGVSGDYIAEGIKYLRKQNGSATLGHQEGGGWCYRYSCSYNSAIYGCNDNQFDVEVPWSTIADYAESIKDKCNWQVRSGRRDVEMVQGQAFDSGDWNVIVGMEDNTSC